MITKEANESWRKLMTAIDRYREVEQALKQVKDALLETAKALSDDLKIVEDEPQTERSE